MNYELISGRSGYRRRAFRYIFARLNSTSLKNSRCPLSVVRCPEKLAKDAAPIPNAWETTNS